ncbi:hypothetical protein [Streptosporangium sp. NPDC002721]
MTSTFEAAGVVEAAGVPGVTGVTEAVAGAAGTDSLGAAWVRGLRDLP